VSYRVIDPYGLIILAGSSVASIEESYSEQARGYLVVSFLFCGLIVLVSALLIVGSVRQRKLLESQHSFNQLIELVPQLVSILDVRGKII
jgi:hypothetical protein